MSKDKAVSALVAKMGNCTPSDLDAVLNAAKDIGDEALIVAACTMICSLWQERPPHQSSWERPLDALCQCKDGGEALLHIAYHARNATVRLEAIRRLGAVGTKAVREYLYQLAKDGLPNAQGFGNNNVVQRDAYRVAALQALGKLDRPEVSDGIAVLDALAQEIGKAEETEAFRVGTASLSHAAKPGHLKAILDAVVACRGGLQGARLLAACSRLDVKTLRTEETRIAEQLASHLPQNMQDAELLDRLCELARKLTSKELLVRMTDSYHCDALNTGRGRVAEAILDSHPAKDAVLTEAYLRFAEAQNNAQSGTKCLAGLAACAAAGNAKAIASRIVRQGTAGHKQIVRGSLAPFVFGSTSAVVNSLCEALDEMDNPGGRDSASLGVCECFVRMSIPGDSRVGWHGTLEGFRREGRDRGADNRYLQPTADALKKSEPSKDALACLADRLCSGSRSSGAVAVAATLLQPSDPLAMVFLDRLLGAMPGIKLSAVVATAADSPLAQVEGLLFPACGDWLRRTLPSHVMTNGHLGRYVLDLMRRHDFQFVENADKALQQVSSPADAGFILNSLAVKGDAKSLRLLARAVEHVFQVERGDAEVRQTALNLLSEIATKPTMTLDKATRQELLAGVHGAFCDTKVVRCTAYTTCGNFADPASIIPLRERQKSEKDGAAREAIKAALESIKKAMQAEKPGGLTSEADTVAWLNHLTDLGDATLVDDALGFLKPRFSEKVQIAALACLAAIGRGSSISAIDAFVEDVSPAGDVLKAAHRTKSILQQRADLPLLDALGAMFPPESPVVDLSINYDTIFGAERVNILASALVRAKNEWEKDQWPNFVTTIDAVCDVLVRHLFEHFPAKLNLSDDKGKVLSKKDYGNRLGVSEFAAAFPSLQAWLLSVHRMRGEAEIAHLENPDGTAKVGIGPDQGKLVMDQFKLLLPVYLTAIT